MKVPQQTKIEMYKYLLSNRTSHLQKSGRKNIQPSFCSITNERFQKHNEGRNAEIFSKQIVLETELTNDLNSGLIKN